MGGIDPGKHSDSVPSSNDQSGAANFPPDIRLVLEGQFGRDVQLCSEENGNCSAIKMGRWVVLYFNMKSHDQWKSLKIKGRQCFCTNLTIPILHIYFQRGASRPSQSGHGKSASCLAPVCCAAACADKNHRAVVLIRQQAATTVNDCCSVPSDVGPFCSALQLSTWKTERKHTGYLKMDENHHSKLSGPVSGWSTPGRVLWMRTRPAVRWSWQGGGPWATVLLLPPVGPPAPRDGTPCPTARAWASIWITAR